MESTANPDELRQRFAKFMQQEELREFRTGRRQEAIMGKIRRRNV